MVAAGYTVTVQPFTFAYAGDLTAPVLTQVAPTTVSFVPRVDFATMSGSGSGDVTAPVTSVDLNIPSSGNGTSGCEPADFAGFPAGSIALVQRGTCDFRDKAVNAVAAGAVAVIMMNEGNTPPREGLLSGTLGTPTLPIPVIGTTYAVGVNLANLAAPPVVRVRVNVASGTSSSSNLIAESPGGDPNSVVVVGANMDGRFGPGINATSGAATLIELARVFAAQEHTPKNRMRFVWFGAYPEGLVGGTYYVDQLSGDERERIAAVIGVEPVGSPNFGRFVLDSDFSDFATSHPPNPAVDAASRGIEALFTDYFAAAGLAASPIIAGTGVAAPFRNAAIPFGGLYAGAEGVKTAEEAFLFGGTAGVAYDPCAWQSCDALQNLSMTALDQMSDAAAHVVLLLSRRNLGQKPLGAN